jgi:hypothetical protein
MVALLAATVTGLLTRRPFFYLPLYWVLSVSALLIGQEIGQVAGWQFLRIGEVELGAGLLVNAAMLVGLRVFSLWYNQQHR